MTKKIGVVIFPGSNCDHDVIYAIENIFQKEAVKLWHKDTELKSCDFIILPGGFSYGDYLRSGAIARFSPIMEVIIEYANNGGLLMGICNGFQILCEAKLLPGALLHNTNRQFICKNVLIKAYQNKSYATKDIPTGKVLKIPIAHGEGRYYIDEKGLNDMKINNQILFTYCNENGIEDDESNPNGSLSNIAGICNQRGNVIGMMPHPERAVDELLANTDGKFIFDSIFNSL